eukprot:470757_1
MASLKQTVQLLTENMKELTYKCNVTLGTIAQMEVNTEYVADERLNNILYGIDKFNQLYSWNYKTGQWSGIFGLFQQISIGSDGTLIGVSKSGSLMYVGDGKLNNPIVIYQGYNKWKLIGGDVTGISVANKQNIWGLCQSYPCKYEGHNHWTKLQGTRSCSQIAVGDDGTLVCLYSGKLYIVSDDNKQINNIVWEEVKISVSLQKIAVGNKENIWGIDGYNKVYRIYAKKKIKWDWENIDGTMIDITVNSKGDVWAVNKINQIFKHIENDEWQRVNGTFTMVSVK